MGCRADITVKLLLKYFLSDNATNLEIVSAYVEETCLVSRYSFCKF
jgi:hypothetical protein